VAINYNSHELEESHQISDRITVLRDGKLVVTAKTSEMDREKLVRAMVGRDISQTVYAAEEGKTEEKAPRLARRERVLTVENVTMGMAVKNMSFSVYAGEVLGIAGLIGSGRTEIAKIIFGDLKRNLIDGGTIKLRGKPVRYRVPKQAINDGIAYVTEDRKLNGFFETMAADDNMYIGKLATKTGWRFFLSRKIRSLLSNLWVERLKISALQRKARMIELSGGNQQKVVIAKSLVQDPSIIIFDEPTRGVDVGTIPQIHEQIRTLAREGKAVVVISSYLPEILSISDRILVARQGRIAAEFDAASATTDKIMYAAIH
jgi:ABC-type sugar transport system ATPase subunit